LSDPEKVGNHDASFSVGCMPTVFRHGPYRFYFYSHDAVEPPHVHVDRDARSAKLWLEPVSVAFNAGFPQPELRRLTRLVMMNRTRLLESWRDHFET